MGKLTFEKWMELVDQELSKECGLTHYDLPDKTYHDWFDDGVSPLDVATIVLESEGYDLLEM